MTNNEKSYLHNSFCTKVESKLDFFGRNPISSILIICIISLLIRLYYFDPEMPVLQDALGYFFYATDINLLKQLPLNYTPANNGWPIFLSLFFSVFQFDNVLSYMQVQRLTSIIISVITIIPVYFLCAKFFDKRFCLLGASIFAFEPRLIQNSLFGITEPLYILLGTTALVLFLESNKKLIYLSFALAAITALVRAEGLFLLLAFSIMFFVRYRKDRLVIPRYILVIIIVVLILLPMSLYKIEASGTDNLFMRVLSSISQYSQTREPSGDELLGSPSVLTGFEHFPKYLGWDLIPIFIFFVPLGAILIFKNLNHQNVTIIVSIVAMSLPAFYAYSIPLPDTRYFYFLYPMLCVISLFTVKKFAYRFDNPNIILILIIGGILLSSSVFLDYKIDNEHRKEAFLIAQQIAKTPKMVNQYLPESGYLEVAEIPQKWSDLKPYFFMQREKGLSIRSSIPHQISVISTNDFDSLEQFIKISKEKGLTHLVIDSNQNRPNFLKDVFYEDEKYPYLIKEYDSFDFGLKYHVKIYEIDFGIFESMNQEEHN